ncbi:MAG TPA: polymer-forming cytoskeletal protein [Rhizomicrobium sp.]|jgi:cytoskeletal protein CcmA (bactofilin family)
MFALKARTASRAETALPVSRLGAGLSVRGNLETEGELHIFGRVIGRIDAGILFVAPCGLVEGDVVAREVRVAGRLMGRIFALTVDVGDGANVQGRIFHHTVTVSRHARFEGRMPWRPPSFFENLDQLPETQP